MKRFLFTLITFQSLLSISQTIALQSFATGFSSPLEITHPVNDSRLFVVQKGGLIKIVNPNGVVNTTPFLNIASIISTVSERGLLGLAFHPNYATNGYFYLNYSNTSGNTVIARYSVSSDPNIALTTGTILLTVTQPYSNHNGGSIKFGPDGYLYIGMGDGGSAGDPGNRAQNINENLGKMLRIDVDSANPYGIPPTNPYLGIAGNDEIWAIGLRNPWKFSFNRLNGDLWIADVCQDEVEEINKIASPVGNTALNFGWKCYEGNVTYNATGCLPASSMMFPVAQYTHSGTGGCSIIGGYFYSGTLYPNFQNKYFFADYCLNRIAYLNSNNTITYSSSFTGNDNFTTFGEDSNGELYVTGSSTVYKIKDTSLDLSEFELKGFSIYPNPANEEFYIKTKTDFIELEVSILDISGKLISNQIIKDKNYPVSIRSLSNGLYFVKVTDFQGNSSISKLKKE